MTSSYNCSIPSLVLLATSDWRSSGLTLLQKIGAEGYILRCRNCELTLLADSLYKTLELIKKIIQFLFKKAELFVKIDLLYF